MKKLLLVPFVLFCLTGSTQTLHRAYIDGLVLGKDKAYVIEMAIKLFNDYYLSNKDDIIKKMKKERKKKLEKLEDRVAFLAEAEKDIREKLEKSDDWKIVDLYSNYLISISTLFGAKAAIPGFGKPFENLNGESYAYLWFKNGYLSAIEVSLEKTNDFNIWSGFEYNNDQLRIISEYIKKNYGTFSYSNHTGRFHVCSQQGEPVFREYFAIKEDGLMKIDGTITCEFGPYIERYKTAYGTKVCRYLGVNHLTSVTIKLSLRE